MSYSQKLKRGITKKFKRLGLSLKKDALNKLLELHDECSNEDEFDQLLEQLGELTLSQKLSTPIISLNQIQPAIDQITNNSNYNQNEENLLSLESAFDAKRFKYKRIRKQFTLLKNGPIHGNASDLSSVFIDRYELLLQRTLRHKIFRRSTLKDKKEDENSYQLTTTSELIGTFVKKRVFGMLCELDEGKIYLQDTSGTVQIDLTKVDDQGHGLFTFNSFVLCIGFMNNNNNIFEITSMNPPPYELRRKTIKTFNNLNFLPFEKQQIMMQLEQKSVDDVFIFVSNVYLDENDTFQKLSKLFDGYQSIEIPPTLFVFMGNFTRQKLGSNAKDIKLLATLFDKFCDLLMNKYSNLCKTSDFIFIPGPNEMNFIGNLLPQPPLLRSLCKKFHYYSDNGQIAVHFQSNPFRIRFGTQEIVCFRQDLLAKMRRNCVNTPRLEDTTDLSRHLCQTIVDQSHLCPLPLQICPLYWNYSHSLNLYPTPDLIVLGDMHKDYVWNYMDTKVVCPGIFSDTGKFIYYQPTKKTVDVSGVL